MPFTKKGRSFWNDDRPAKIFAVGLMSGTSADGVDAALVNLSRKKNRLVAEPRAYLVEPYPVELRRRLMQLVLNRRGALSEVCSLNFEIGEVFAAATLRLLKKNRIDRSKIAFIASHGQTVWHLPHALAHSTRSAPSTLQISEPAVIARRTGLPVVSNFRTADMAAGGEGAPLIPFVDYHLFSHPRQTRVVQNLGGIANATYLRAGGTLRDVLAFDSGPANLVLDNLVQLATDGRENFDRDGRRARRGKIAPKILKTLLRHPYFRLPLPKSTGRETFGRLYARRLLDVAKRQNLSLADALATATELTARTVVDSYARFFPPDAYPDEVILGGGGARNSFLVDRIRALLPPATRLTTHESHGINSDAKEAIGFALIGYASYLGIPANVPTVTGAHSAVRLGQWTFP
ncbi:MAG: anhydro-N-acetylmuramic acid kinase [bacterium]